MLNSMRMKKLLRFAAVLAGGAMLLVAFNNCGAAPSWKTLDSRNAAGLEPATGGDSLELRSLSATAAAESESFEVLDVLPGVFAAAQGPCRASTASEYLRCIRLVQAGASDSITISGMIDCDGPNACAGSLNGVNRPITIGGADGPSGFIRNDKNYSVLSIDRSSQVTLKNLIFDDVVSATYLDSGPSLPSTLSINNTPIVTVDGVTVKHSSAQTSVSIADVSNLVFKNSTVSDGGAMGLWLNGITSLTISDCTFSENRSNGLFIEKQGKSDSVIENSKFYRNHRMAIYNSCGGPCGGGQIAIVTAWNLTIRNNRIWDGSAANVQVAGIELNNPTHLTIRNNVIESHTGSAIYSNTGIPVETNILNNTFNNNGSALWNLKGANVSGNGPQK